VSSAHARIASFCSACPSSSTRFIIASTRALAARRSSFALTASVAHCFTTACTSAWPSSKTRFIIASTRALACSCSRAFRTASAFLRCFSSMASPYQARNTSRCSDSPSNIIRFISCSTRFSASAFNFSAVLRFSSSTVTSLRQARITSLCSASPSSMTRFIMACTRASASFCCNAAAFCSAWRCCISMRIVPCQLRSASRSSNSPSSTNRRISALTRSWAAFASAASRSLSCLSSLTWDDHSCITSRWKATPSDIAFFIVI